MKIRNPALIKWIGFLGAILIRLWIGTLSLRYRSLGKDIYPDRVQPPVHYIAAFWHENILVPCYLFARPEILVLISQHADGEMIAQVCEWLGFGTIRGSKTRGGIKAMREMVRSCQGHYIAVMPDGPRGPRRKLELGLIYLAAKTGLPIVLLGVGHDRPWRLKTWDRFCLPRPFSTAIVVASEPIHIPEDADRATLESYRERVEQMLTEVTDYAERLASC